MAKKNGKIYLNPRGGLCGTDPLYVRGVGVGESVAGGSLTFGDMAQNVLMLFHTEAYAVIEGRRQELRPGAVILWSRHTPSQYGALPGVEWSHSWIVFGGDEAQRMIREAELKQNHVYDCPDLEGRFTASLTALYDELMEYPAMDQKMRQLLLETLLHAIGRRVKMDSQQLVPQRLVDARDYINSNLGRRLSLADIASHAYYSVPRFSSLFTRFFQQSPMEYLQQQRLQMAAHLLRTSTLPVGEVARFCGFNSQLYFSSRFRGYWGMSPTEYRGRG